MEQNSNSVSRFRKKTRNTTNQVTYSNYRIFVQEINKNRLQEIDWVVRGSKKYQLYVLVTTAIFELYYSAAETLSIVSVKVHLLCHIIHKIFIN